MNISIQAKSSSGGTPYEVTFSSEAGLLTVRCDCQAGVFGKLCKHKTELLAGDLSRLYNSDDVGKLRSVLDVIEGKNEIQDAAVEIARTEAIIKAETALNKKAKKRLESLLNQGVRIS